MGKKIWLSMHPRNLGSEKIVCTTNVRPYVRPPGHVSRGEVLHFKYARVSAVNRIATRTFTDKKNNNNNKADSFFHLILMSTLTWITEKELKRLIKNKGDQFRRKNDTNILKRR